MILTFKHKGLRLLYQTNDTSKLPASQIDKIVLILTRLEAAKDPQDLNRPGAGFHGLSGDLKGFFAVKVNKNYRIIFRFNGEDVVDVDYLDYH